MMIDSFGGGVSEGDGYIFFWRIQGKGSEVGFGYMENFGCIWDI